MMEAVPKTYTGLSRLAGPILVVENVDDVAYSEVVEIEGWPRVEEVAAMLGGAEPTVHMIESANELIESAATWKNLHHVATG